MKILRSASIAAMAAAILLAGCVAVGGHQNPIDPLSNVHELDYTDVDVRRPDFDEPFVRDGVVSQPAVFREIGAGLAAESIRQRLGEPLQQQDGPRGREWDYHFKFAMPDSANHLVCQYKVVFAADGDTVRETAWRRRQCLDLVEPASGT